MDSKIKVNKYDIIVICFILVSSMALYGMFFFHGRGEGSKVEIIVDGRLYEIVGLEEDNTINIENRCTLKIKNKKAYISYSTCHNQLCVHQGAISKPGQTICCLPNSVVVTIINKDSNVDYIIN